MSLVAIRILRLSIIVVKEFTQPVKRLLVKIAQRNGFFRKYICKPPANFHNWCEHQLLLLLHKDKSFEPLTEECAIDLGAAIWAEIIVFIGCSKAVLLEMNRKPKKESAERVIENSDEELGAAVDFLLNRLEQQSLYIERIINALEELGITIERKQIKRKEHKIDQSFVEMLD